MSIHNYFQQTHLPINPIQSRCSWFTIALQFANQSNWSNTIDPGAPGSLSLAIDPLENRSCRRESFWRSTFSSTSQWCVPHSTRPNLKFNLSQFKIQLVPIQIVSIQFDTDLSNPWPGEYLPGKEVHSSTNQSNSTHCSTHLSWEAKTKFQGRHFPLSLNPQVQPEIEHTRRPKMRRKRRRRQSQRALKPPSNRSGAGTLGQRERALRFCTGWRSAMSTGGLELTFCGGKWRGREFVGAGGPGRVWRAISGAFERDDDGGQEL